MYVFFLESSSFSNWYPAPFKWRGITFNCIGQYYAWRKAVHFKDASTAQKILSTDDPLEQKTLGNFTDNYNAIAWMDVCVLVMKEGLMCKFHQNPDLKRELMATRGKIIVKATADDGYWGIGCSATEPRSKSCATWKGANNLGYLLTETREDLIANPPDV